MARVTMALCMQLIPPEAHGGLRMSRSLPPLWDHQKRAVAAVVGSGFKDGVIAHATGTGKSRTAWELVSTFGTSNPGRVVLWVCERANVLRDLFSQQWTAKGLSVLNLVERKDHEWAWKAQAATCWGRPVLVIVTRAYLASRTRYRHLHPGSVGLVVHDECHSGCKGTMEAFFVWLRSEQKHARVIGLSATPPTGSRIVSRFSIYDAMCAGVILPVKLVWGGGLSAGDLGSSACLSLAEEERIRKIIVWCGTIEHAERAMAIWSATVEGCRWRMAVDTSRPRQEHPGYDEFRRWSEPAALFCAAKHREGSDIPGLGMAVFVDGVPKRGAGVFVQCVGRVLRRGDGGRRHGFVVDLSARDGLELCDRVGKYLCLPPGVHPWSQTTRRVPKGLVHTLALDRRRPAGVPSSPPVPSIWTIEGAFARAVPDKPAYRTRLERELDLILSKGLQSHLRRAVEVLQLAGADVQHVTRGSCGSSLTCYLLGISHVDPVRYKISFARFLNEFRDSLPDIDYDFPHHRRNEIFMAIAQRWPGKVARISNHVHFHEKSALRAALRQCGLRGGIPSAELARYISGLDAAQKRRVERCARELDGSFNCYSLHCGGIVYYPEGVPEEDILETRRGHLLAQVKSDKRAAAKDGQFKIDVLSSRALAQLVHVMDRCGRELHLEDPPFTQAMCDLFARGDNIGLTLAESPLSRGEQRARSPKSVEEVAACMALIRPAARKSEIQIVYDDDAIRLIARAAKIPEAEADCIRRKLSKNDPEAVRMLAATMDPEEAEALRKKLGSLSMYGFCKAHAMSYAQLVCWLAWCKTEHPRLFWEGALLHCQSFYKPWVHIWEAHRAGVTASSTRPAGSVFAQARRRRLNGEKMMVRLRKSWTWDPADGFVPGCYVHRDEQGRPCRFRGVIASTRRLSDDALALTVGTGTEYLDLTVPCGGLNGGSRVAVGILTDGAWTCRFS